jgi:NUMOD3 motif
MFLTYAHYTPQGRLFYIGKGSSERRAHYFGGRNNYWNKVVAKYGKPDVQILAHWDTEEEALSHEVLLISCFREMGHQLCNITDGGEGTSGYVHTEEHRRKNSLAKLGKPATWNIGRKHTEETKLKISIAQTGKIASDKQRQVASQVHKGNKYSAGNTAQRKWKWVGVDANGIEHVFVGEQALKDAGLSHANIIKCINGERKSHKGYTWSKEELEIA